MTQEMSSCDQCSMAYPERGLKEIAGKDMCSYCAKGHCDNCGGHLRRKDSVVTVKKCNDCGQSHNLRGAKI